jgi:pimeloyl-ACP methyl ester carboxylesterase
VFARHFRCLIIDLPGYGGSDPVEGPPVPGCVEAVLRLLDGLGVERCHILGNSLGGIVGSFVAAYHPQRVTRFVTIGGIGMNVFTAFPGEGLRLLTAFAEEPTRENIQTWLRSMVFDQSIVTEELIESRLKAATNPVTLATSRQLYSRLRRGAGRRVPRPECHAAHRASRLDPGTHADNLGPRRPREPDGHGPDPDARDPACGTARVPEMRPLGNDRVQGGVRDAGAGVPAAGGLSASATRVRGE